MINDDEGGGVEEIDEELEEEVVVEAADKEEENCNRAITISSKLCRHAKKMGVLPSNNFALISTPFLEASFNNSCTIL